MVQYYIHECYTHCKGKDKVVYFEFITKHPGAKLGQLLQIPIRLFRLGEKSGARFTSSCTLCDYDDG